MSVENSPSRAFFRVQPLPVAMSELLERWQPRRRQEIAATAAALGRNARRRADRTQRSAHFRTK